MGTDVNHRQPRTMYTPLHVAAQTGNADIIKLLMESGADPSLLDISGFFPVHHAIQNRHNKIILSLLPIEHDVNLVQDPVQCETLIFHAVKSNDEELCLDLIKRGSNLDFVNREGLKPIHLAIRLKFTEIFDILYKHVQNPNVVDESGDSLLALAAIQQCDKICESICRSKRWLNIFNRNNRGDTALHKLSQFGSAKTMSLVLSNGKLEKQIINSRNDIGDTPLHVAVRNGEAGISRILLATGARLDIVNDQGDTPLHLVAKSNDLKVAEVLLEFGAARTLVCKNDDGITPLQIVDKQISRQLERLFLIEQDSFRQCKKVVIKREDYSGTLDQLHQAVIHNQIDLFKVLVERGTNVNRRNWEGYRCIDLALKYQRYDIFEALLDNPKCDVYALNKHGKTVFQTALQEVKFPYLKVLLERRSENLNAFNGGGYTLLHTAINSNMYYLCKMLVTSKGVDINLRNGQGQTPLYMASQLGHVQIVQLLLAHKACTALCDNNSQTPLHVAAKNGHLEICKYILESHYNNVNQADSRNETALHLAIENGHYEVTHQLLLGGAKMVYNNWLLSPLHVAINYNRIEIVKLLVETYQISPNYRHSFTNETPCHIANRQNSIAISRYLVDQGADLMIPDKRMLYPFCSYARCLFQMESKIDQASAEFHHYTWLWEKFNETLGDLATSQIVSLSIEFDNQFVHENYIQDPSFPKDITNSQGDTMMHVAAISGRERAVEVMLLVDSDTSATNAMDQNNTPMHKACQFNQVKVIKTMGNYLKDSSLVNSKNDQGNTPLHLAARGGHLESCAVMLNLGADLNIENNLGYTPLHLAVAKGRSQLVEYFLNIEGKHLSHFENSRNDTLLNVAVEYGNLDICEMLLGYFSFSITNNANDKRALETSIKKGQYQISKMLIDHHQSKIHKNAGQAQILEDQNLLVHLAAVNKQSQILKYIVENGADINSRDRYGQSSLHIVAKLGYLHVCQFLLESKADPNALDMDQNTPLHLAINSSRFEAANLLVSHQQNINSQNAHGETPLHIAARINNYRICNILLSAGADMSQTDGSQNTPLHVATQNYSSQTCKLLYSQGGDINVKNGEGNTVLHLMITQEKVNEQLFADLINQGTRIDIANAKNQTLLQMGIVGGHLRNFEIVASQFSNQELESQEVVHWAAEYNSTQILKYLISRNVSVNTLNAQGENALYLGVKRGFEGVCKMLIKADADVNLQNSSKNKDYPLHAAVQSRKRKLVALLLANGAQQHRTDSNKNNPLNLAIQLRYEGIFSVMVKLLPKVTCQAFNKMQKENCEGCTPLHTAVKSNDLLVVQRLIQASFNPNIQNVNGETPLHFAARQGQNHLCELLIQHQGDPSIQNVHGNTPWMAALVKGNVQLLEGFLDIYKLDLGIQNKQGDTLVHMLIENNQFQLLELLAVKHQGDPQLDHVFNIGNFQKSSPLHLACTYGNIQYLDLIEKFSVSPVVNLQDINGNTALHVAAHFHHTQICERLIGRGWDIHKTNFAGQCPLQVAIQCGVLPRDSFSLDYGTQLQYTESWGSDTFSGGQSGSQRSDREKESPRKTYVSTETQAQIDTCKLLLQKGGKVSLDSSNSLQILQIALERGYYQICAHLVESGLVSDLPLQQKMRMVEIAVINNHKPLFDLLFDKTQNINLPNIYGDSLLHVAAIRNCGQIALKLVAEGADMELGDKNGYTPIFCALKHGNIDLVHQLLVKGANPNNQKNIMGENLLHHALSLENNLAVDSFVALNNVEYYAVNNKGQNALHLASSNPNGMEICQKLLLKGLKVDSVDDNGCTPLFYTCQRNQEQTFAFLLSQNANITHLNKAKETLLHVVATQGYANLAQKIMANLPTKFSCINLQQQNLNGNTPLHLASKANSLQICQMLISSKADTNAVNSNGYTPLILAAQEGNWEVCHLLLNNEAEINFRSPINKQTALHVSIVQHNDEVTQALLRAGADPGIKNRDKYPYQMTEKSNIPKSWNHFENLSAKELEDYFAYPVFELCYRKQYKFLKYLKEKDPNFAKYVQKLQSLSSSASIFHFSSKANNLGPKIDPFDQLQNTSSTQEQIPTQIDTQQCPNTLSPKISDQTWGSEDQFYSVSLTDRINIDIHNSTQKSIEQINETENKTEEQTKENDEKKIELTQESEENIPKQKVEYSEAKNKEMVEASRKGHLYTCVELVKQGADPNLDLTDKYQSRLLHYISFHGLSKLVEPMLKLGANINILNSSYSTPLHLAAVGNHASTCSALQKCGSDINAQDRHRYTPLHLASYRGLDHICELLIRSGCDMNVKGIKGYTPLHVAAQEGRFNSCIVLIKSGADPSITNDYGQTPYQQKQLSVIPRGWKNVRGPQGYVDLPKEYKNMYCTYEVFKLCFAKKYKFLDYIRKNDSQFQTYMQRYSKEYIELSKGSPDVNGSDESSEGINNSCKDIFQIQFRKAKDINASYSSLKQTENA